MLTFTAQIKECKDEDHIVSVPAKEFHGVEVRGELGELLNDIVHHDALLELGHAQVLELAHGRKTAAFLSSPLAGGFAENAIITPTVLAVLKAGSGGEELWPAQLR
jgi:hypothetical protein